MKLSTILMVIALLVIAATADAGKKKSTARKPENPQSHWNQFRGPAGDGRSLATNLPVEFSETKNVRWKTAIHGKGYSSPVVWDNQVWLTTAREDGSELFAVCVDLQTGKIIHDVRVFDVAKPQSAYAYLNSHASSTPVVEQGRIYVHFGSYGTACLDTSTGKKLWERRDLHCDHRVRPGSSPIVDGDSLFVAFDGVDKQFFVALDKNTGKTRWLRDRNVVSDWDATLRASGIDPQDVKKKKPGDNKKSYATARLIKHRGQRQLIAPAAEATISYDPRTGKELWRVHHFGGFNVACRPLFNHGLVYVFTSGLTGHFLAVRPTGTGDVTKTHIEWSTKRGTPHIPSPIIVDDLLFTVTEKSGIVRCLDAKRGKEIWRKRVGGSHWASPLYADGKIYFFSKEGRVPVISAEREFQLVAENRLDASFIASPATAGEALLLRSRTHLYHVARGYTRVAETVAASRPPARDGVKPKPSKKSPADLEELAIRLKAAVADGTMTEEDAIAEYKKAAATAGGKKQPLKKKQLSEDSDVDLKALGARLKQAVADGKMTKKEAMAEFQKASQRGTRQVVSPGLTGRLTYKGAKGAYIVIIELSSGDKVTFVGESFRKQFADKEVGEPVTIQLGPAAGKTRAAMMKRPGKKPGTNKSGGTTTFYSIVVGRLKSKDIELGEFTMDVDYITAIYGDRRLKKRLLGKTIKVVGVSGAWLDTLLLIKKGETLQFRSGTLQGTTVSISPKATVLERTVPFDPEVYPIPPEDFRGFQGTVVGRLTSKSDQGYELTLRVEKIEQTARSSTATKPQLGVGRLMSMRGFFAARFREQFDDLRIGDRIRVGTAHREPTVDSFEVTGAIEKLPAKETPEEESKRK